MIEFYHKTFQDAYFEQIAQPQEGCWIHVNEASAHDITVLAELSGLPAQDLQDCLDHYEVPRIEIVQNSTLIFTRFASEHEAGLYTSTLTFILTPHYLITISPSSNELIQQFIAIKNKFSSAQKTFLLVGLLACLAQDFTVHIRRLRQQVLRQETEKGAIKSEDISDLTKNEEIINQYYTTLIPIRHILESLLTGRFKTLSVKENDAIHDVLNSIKQSEDLCNISIKTIRSLRDCSQIIFTNNVNKTIKLLTAFTILLSLPTMVATVYGMNVSLPYQNDPNGFYYVMGLVALLILIAGAIFQRMKWL
jgi:magnesium transporter